MNKMLDYRCPECGRTTEHFHMDRECIAGEWHENGEPPTTVPCERCGHVAARVPSAPPFRIAKGKFYDAATNKTFENEDACKAYCRENGLSVEPASHHAEYLERRQQEVRIQLAKDEAEWAADCKMYNEDPGHAEYRKQVDNGYFVDKAVEAAAKNGKNINRSDVVLGTALGEGASA